MMAKKSIREEYACVLQCDKLLILIPMTVLAQAERDIVDLSFNDWIKKTFGRLGSVWILTVATAVYNIYVSVSNAPVPQLAIVDVHVSQALIILLILGFLAFGKRPPQFHAYPRASLAVRQFWNWWLWVWFAWFILYVTLAILEHYGGALGSETALAKFAVHTLNNLSSVLVLMCYHVLASLTVKNVSTSLKNIGSDDSSKESLYLIKEDKTAPGKMAFWLALFVGVIIFEFGVLIGTEESAKIKDFSILFELISGCFGCSINCAFGW